MSSPVLMRRLAGVAVVALVVAACGSGDGAASTTSTVDASSTSTTMATSTTLPEVTTTLEATTSTEVVTGQTVQVVFASDQPDCSDTKSFDRIIDEAAEPIESAFQLLVAGPTPEEQATGAGSFFSPETEGMVRSVTVADGLLTVDFADLRPVIPNASTSCGHLSLIAQLNGTAFQFGEVDRVTYSIDGSCDTFFNWLQTDCQEYARP